MACALFVQDGAEVKAGPRRRGRPRRGFGVRIARRRAGGRGGGWPPSRRRQNSHWCVAALQYEPDATNGQTWPKKLSHGMPQECAVCV